MERKLKQCLSPIPPISITRTITSHLNSLNHKKDHNKWRWKSRSWLGTGTKMW